MLERMAKGFLSMEVCISDEIFSDFCISERFRQLWSEVVASRTPPLSGFHFKAAISEEVKYLKCRALSIATPFLKRNTTCMSYVF